MHTTLGPGNILKAPGTGVGLAQHLAQALTQGVSHSALEEAAGFGRWWFDPVSSQMVLSALAARYLNVEALHHTGLDSCFIHVVSDDMLGLIAQLPHGTQRGVPSDFRVISPVEGLRWLRLVHLPQDPANPGLVSGILSDITPLKHAAMRERLGFELTEFLVGTHPLGDAITNVIQLICKNLGWDWGAYWAAESFAPDESPRLSCKYFWHQPELDLASFGAESASRSLAPGEGLVGAVWQSGQPDWVEDMVNDLRFSQRTNDRECKLWSGYVFPVTYVSADGHTHSPGVLEFYSCLSRQPEAQLPKVSAIEHQTTILYLAQVDALTGLANRNHFHELVSQACAAAAKDDKAFGLAFIDLVRAAPGKSLMVGVRRANENLALAVTPDAETAGALAVGKIKAEVALAPEMITLASSPPEDPGGVSVGASSVGGSLPLPQATTAMTTAAESPRDLIEFFWNGGGPLSSPARVFAVDAPPAPSS